HTEGEPQQENYVDSTFDEKGSYDEVVYCTVCGKELNRNTITIPKKSHTAGTAIVENKVDSTCKETGTYDEVVYCTECGEELSRVQKTIEKKTTHTEDEATTENLVDSTCKDTGYYDEVVYCSVCDKELSRETKTIAKKATHIPAMAVQENYVDSTCELEGSYDKVIYCSICGVEMSREVTVIDKVEHTVVIDPYVESTCISNGLTEGSHCGVCGTVLVEQISIPAAHKYSLSVYTDKSCVSEALTTYTCSVCGDNYTCNVAPITANIQKTSYEITDGHFSSVRYTVTASGGVGDLSYRHILWRSRTDTTVLYNSGFVSSNTYEIYTKDGSSMDDYVWIITIKDNYGYAVHYYISVVDDACLRYEYAGTVTHDYKNHICIDCQKEEPYEAIYDISANLDGSLVAKLYNNGNETYELDITGSGNMTYSSRPWSMYDSLITKVNISEGVTSIGEYAFSSFVRLQSINIPNTVTSIGNYAFSGCSGLTSVTIGDGVTNIGERTFYNCKALEHLYFNSVAMNDLSSNNNVFSCAGQNSNGIKVTFGSKVTRIPAYLFCCESSSSSPNVASINFENGSVCTIISAGAFSGVSSLVELQLPDGITEIGMSAFYGCTGLTTLAINAVNIGDSAFYGCAGLTTLSINSINVGDRAFYNCSALTTLNIGEAVVTIGRYAFENCSALEIINFNAATMNDLDSDARAFYYAGINGNGIKVNVGSNVTRIPAYLFSKYDLYAGSTETKISIVHFEENSICESIGEYSFNHCDSLTEINLPESLTSIGDKAFYYCVNLTNITIPYNITFIGDYAFAQCSALETIHFNATAMEDVSAWDYVF
ncbi:MAG: leucine-rich repeat protein, partial [Bacteroidales bacterium]|nr:leucine-rich repeat protein [Bacteroidales bacterium]